MMVKDKTFSDRDIIRIFENHLTLDEQFIVWDYFQNITTTAFGTRTKTLGKFQSLVSNIISSVLAITSLIIGLKGTLGAFVDVFKSMKDLDELLKQTPYMRKLDRELSANIEAWKRENPDLAKMLYP